MWRHICFVVINNREAVNAAIRSIKVTLHKSFKKSPIHIAVIFIRC